MLRILAVVSRPSMKGSCQAMKIMSYASLPKSSTAFAPCAAKSTRHPNLCSILRATCAFTSSFSTTRTEIGPIDIGIHCGRHVMSTRTGISFLTGTAKSDGGSILKSDNVAGIVPEIRIWFP
jgi:hypothetical protein